MSNSRLERFAAAAGLIFVVMGLAYIFLSPSMDPLAPAVEVAGVYTKNSAGALLWNFVGTLAFFFFLFFLGALYNVLRQAEGGTGWLSLILSWRDEREKGSPSIKASVVQETKSVSNGAVIIPHSKYLTSTKVAEICAVKERTRVTKPKMI